MVHIKKYTEKDSDDKKSNLSKPMVTKKKSPNKKKKPSNRKLEGEKHLSDDVEGTFKKGRKPSSKKLDGEKFLSGDIEIKKFNEMQDPYDEDNIPDPMDHIEETDKSKDENHFDKTDNDKLIFKLAYEMLNMAADEFGNHGCNDLEKRIIDMIPESWLEEMRQLNSNGQDPWPENKNQIGDSSLMWFLSRKLREMSR